MYLYYRTTILSIIFLLLSTSLLAQPASVRSEVLIEDPRIGLVQGIDLGNEQNIYVGDALNFEVHRYRSSGEYDHSFGRQGRGPGEFRGVYGIRIGPEDSLYVYDSRARRITVFSMGSEIDFRTMHLPPGPEQLTPGVVGTLVAGIKGLWLASGGRPLVVYKPAVNPMQELNEGRPLEIRFGVASSGTSPVLRTRDRHMLALKGEGGATLTVMPFAKKPVIDMHRSSNFLYFGYTDSLVIRKKLIEGQAQTVVSHEFSRVELSDDLLRSRLKMKGQKKYLKKFGTVRRKAPSYVPAIEDFAVDDERRIWVAVNTKRALEGGYTEYRIFDLNGKLIRKISFDRLVFLKAFSETNAYGIATKPSGAQQIVRASLDTLLP